MADRSKGRAQTDRHPGPPGWGLGVRLTTSPRKKTALFRNLMEAKTGLNLWSDTGEGKD